MRNFIAIFSTIQRTFLPEGNLLYSILILMHVSSLPSFKSKCSYHLTTEAEIRSCIIIFCNNNSFHKYIIHMLIYFFRLCLCNGFGFVRISCSIIRK